jgi:hypothetical protein
VVGHGRMDAPAVVDILRLGPLRGATASADAGLPMPAAGSASAAAPLAWAAGPAPGESGTGRWAAAASAARGGLECSTACASAPAPTAAGAASAAPACSTIDTKGSQIAAAGAAFWPPHPSAPASPVARPWLASGAAPSLLPTKKSGLSEPRSAAGGVGEAARVGEAAGWSCSGV